ncbi:MAG: hypothetical protein IIX02_05455 [Clostridia bacterium]|jgi:hypothetical protein|nr:hypothetical protein [Clostridia bacterium]
MSAYVLSVIGTILLCAILTAVLPDGKTSTVIKGLARLACVISIVMPVLIFFQSGEWSVGEIFFQEDFSKSVIQTDEAFIQYYSEMRVRETQTNLQEELFKEFSVKSNVKIAWSMENTEYAERYEEYKIKITQIHVENREKQTEEVERAMWVYLTENYCSEVLIE